jgi:hypothetical protein
VDGFHASDRLSDAMAVTRATAVTIGIALLAGAAEAEAPKMLLGKVLVITALDAAPPRGAQGTLFQADRGGRKGQYLLVSTGEPKTAIAIEGAPASEYRLLSPETAGALPDVDVLGIHYINVRPERAEAFEQFVARTLHPAVANLRPDLRLLYYKATSGPDAGSYITIFALTRESRDKYWPGGSDSDDLREAFKPVQPLTAELSTYLVEGSALTDPRFAAAIFESRTWTDFVLVPSK